MDKNIPLLILVPWGPPEGFNMPADYEAITPWTITFSEPGIYKSFNKLVDAKKGTLYAELYTTIQVDETRSLSYTYLQ